MQELQASRQIVTREQFILNTPRNLREKLRECQVRDIPYNERDAEAREDTVKSTQRQGWPAGRLF